MAAHAPVPVDVAPIPSTSEQQQLVGQLREMTSYIHTFRDKMFAIGFGGELVKADMLGALVNDVMLLHAIGMCIVLVHGSRPQVEEQFALRSVQTQFVNGIHVTGAIVLESVKEASGELHLDIEAAFNQGLPNTPMAGARMSVVSGNFMTVRPVGIVDGVNLQCTGLVRKIDAESIQHSLSNHRIVLLLLLSPSSTGQALNLPMEDVAANTATTFKADKPIFITKLPGIMNHVGKLQQDLSTETAIERLRGDSLSHGAAYYLQHIAKAMRGGVRRAHVIPFALDDSILLGLSLRDGVGIAVSHTNLECLREATLDDAGGIVSSIKSLGADGTLVPRKRRLPERDITNLPAIEHDGIVLGRVALYPYPKDGMTGVAHLIVSPDNQSTGGGKHLLKYTEVRARALGLKRLFILTARMEHRFLKRGFVRASADDLPEDRRKLYN